MYEFGMSNLQKQFKKKEESLIDPFDDSGSSSSSSKLDIVEDEEEEEIAIINIPEPVSVKKIDKLYFTLTFEDE